MVYDDTRWVQRLRRMGCWDEAKARKGVEDGEKVEDGSTEKRPVESYSVQLSSILMVLSRVQSVRGAARQEYGKIYGALSPYYLDISRTDVYLESKVFRSFREPEQQAQILSELSRFAKSDITQGWATREGRLTAVIKMFESAVLREFAQ
jgi:recyclin-1